MTTNVILATFVISLPPFPFFDFRGLPVWKTPRLYFSLQKLRGQIQNSQALTIPQELGTYPQRFTIDFPLTLPLSPDSGGEGKGEGGFSRRFLGNV
jgi:hypothetical protein